MVWLTTGPMLRDRIEGRLKCRAMYRYCDAEGRKLPEYAATHIRIAAFHSVMADGPVAELAARLGAMEHCVSVEQIVGHKTLRPQAVAMFERVSS